MGKSDFIKDYLHFSRKERIGVMALLIILGAILILPRLFSMQKEEIPVQADTEWARLMKSVEHNNDQTEEKTEINQYMLDPPAEAYNINKGELFRFDPNSLDAAGWKKLGLRDKTINTIINYRNKGGQFRKPDDLERIYGLKAEEYNRLKPFISIENRYENHPRSVANQSYSERTPYKSTEFPRSKNKAIDINAATADEWIALPGIGEKLATRIILFRDKLGGFHSVDQIAETYALPDSTFQKIKPLLLTGDGQVKKININTATKEELKGHPYLNWKVANAIVEYRNQHGAITNIEDLRKIVLLPEDVLQKITPYLSVE